ncbi:MAG: GvpL/GvpF family gas vesicle protein [Myxococcales bacterium]|nr:GvpL/GvpF family gas vesicle protein [Myxococcales bacterium]
MLLGVIARESAAAAAALPELRCVEHDAIAALLGPAPRDPRTPALPELIAFERALDQVHALVDVLPARFGAVFEHPRGLAAHLTKESDRYRARLEHVRGCTELGARLRVCTDAAPLPASPPRPASGAAYLRARRRELALEERGRDEADALYRSLIEAVAGLARDSRAELSPGEEPGRLELKVALLVERARVNACCERFARWRQSAAVHGALTGPWPPYSFVDPATGAR